MNLKTTRGRFGVEYIDVPVSFDIETTNFYEYDGMQVPDNEVCDIEGKLLSKYKKYVEARATMWGWSMCIGKPEDKNCKIGRTWDEWLETLNLIKEKWSVSPKKRCIIYVHNLPFDMSFFQYWLNWTGQQVTRGNGRPIYALSKDGFEFRCSAALTNAKLEDVKLYKPEHQNIRKLTGEIDYTLPRNCETELTEEEMAYMRMDVKVINALLIEEREIYGSIADIPLTMTGKVRKYMNENLLGDKGMRKWMENSLINPKRYIMLRQVYNGGFIDSSPQFTDDYCVNPNHIDLKSEYPSVLVYEKFPFGKGDYIGCPKDADEFNRLIDNYCCIFRIRLIGIKSKSPFVRPLKTSKIKDRKFENALETDGHIINADVAELTLNEVQYKYLYKFYDWTSYQIKDMIIYEKAYLPKSFIKCVLDLFQKKESSNGKEREWAKIMINAIYGCCAMDINKKKWKISGEKWVHDDADLKKEIEKYNVDLMMYKRWADMKIGIWCASYACRNLLYGIEAMGSDYICCNTDSIFYKNNHDDYIEKYNAQIERKAKRVSHGLTLPIELFKGKDCLLGQWKREHFDTTAHKSTICRMKALSGQRYIIEEELGTEALKTALNDKDQKGRIYNDNKILTWTVAGPGSKKGCAEYLVNEAKQKGVDPFELFDDDLEIPAEAAKRPQHTKQIDRRDITGTLTDYRGHSAKYYERSFTHIGHGSFNLSKDQIVDDLMDGWLTEQKSGF